MSLAKVSSTVGTSFATVAQKFMHKLPHIWFELSSIYWTQFRLRVIELIIPIYHSSVQSNSVRLTNPFVPNVPFLYPQMFSVGRERVHWERMG